jgi:hypothetical protein
MCFSIVSMSGCAAQVAVGAADIAYHMGGLMPKSYRPSNASWQRDFEKQSFGNKMVHVSLAGWKVGEGQYTDGLILTLVDNNKEVDKYVTTDIRTDDYRNKNMQERRICIRDFFLKEHKVDLGSVESEK